MNSLDAQAMSMWIDYLHNVGLHHACSEKPFPNEKIMRRIEEKMGIREHEVSAFRLGIHPASISEIPDKFRKAIQETIAEECSAQASPKPEPNTN